MCLTTRSRYVHLNHGQHWSI